MNSMKKISIAVAVLGLLASPALADKKLDDALVKAEKQLGEGKVEEAVKTVQKAASTAEGYIALARFQLKAIAYTEDAVKGANASLQKGVDSLSADPAGKALVASEQVQMALAFGTAADALKAAETAVAIQKTPASLGALARAQARSQMLKKALDTADEAVKVGPQSADAHYARGEALLALERTNDAEAAYRKALELDPRLDRAHAGLSTALRLNGKAAEAVAEADKATKANPNSGEAYAALALAKLAENSANAPAAINISRDGDRVAPKNPAVHMAVGTIFVAMGDPAHAEEAYQKAVGVDPTYVPARVELVQMQVRQGKIDAALEQAKRLATDLPGSADIQLQLGRLLLMRQQFEPAVAALEKAVALGGSAEMYRLLGTAYQYVKKPDQAVGAMKKAVELAPENQEFHMTYGQLLAKDGKYDEAVAEVKKVVSAPGYSDPNGWLALGGTYRAAKRYDEAAGAFKKALALDAKNEQAAIGLGWAHLYAKQYDEAIAAFQNAVKINPDVVDQASDGTAWAYYFKKDYPQAKAFLAKAEEAGRADATLKDTIARAEKGQEAAAEGPKEQEGPDIATLVNRDMNSKNPAVRRRAVVALKAAGREAVPYIAFAVLNDGNIDVREAAVAALQSMGPAAREAIPSLKQAIARPVDVNVGATRAEMEMEIRLNDLKTKMKAAVERIQGGR